MCFFRIWKYGIFVAICSWFHPFLSNCLLMRAFWKKVFKNLFLELGRKMWFSEKRQKLLYFDKALWPNHLTYSKPLGISGKTMSISFIWYPGIWNLSSHWVTVALWKRWPLKGSGRKWVIRPYPPACPCQGQLYFIKIKLPLFCWSSKYDVLPVAKFSSRALFFWTSSFDKCSRRFLVSNTMPLML